MTKDLIKTTPVRDNRGRKKTGMKKELSAFGSHYQEGSQVNHGQANSAKNKGVLKYNQGNWKVVVQIDIFRSRKALFDDKKTKQ